MRFRKIIVLVYSVGFVLNFQSIVSGQNLDDSLLGYWKFDETSGTTAIDASGNNYDAELFNAGDGSSSWTEGKVNGAIELDGVNDYLAIQTLNYTQAGEIPAVTVVVWVKTIKTGQSYVISYDRSENWRFTVGGDLSNGRLFFASTDSSGTTSDDYGSTELSDGNWHLVVASYDSSTGLKKFYLDGNPDGTITTHSNNALGNGAMTRFGTIGTVNEDIAYNTLEEGARGGFFEGSIDEIRLYDRALSDSEVNYLYFQATTDSDSDGLTNAEEDSLGTNSSNTDTDGDGISDWGEINGYHTYTEINGVMTWTAAKADAESRGGYLATITSAEEKSRVVGAASLDYLWLGGSDASSEGTWTWLSGEAWDYSNWGSGEPNDSSGEDYLTLTAARQWNDTADSYENINGYILETEHASTNPLQADSDGDGVDDLSEINQDRDPNLVELSGWTSVGAGTWSLSNADLTVRQTENEPELYYLSPYDILNKSVTFSMGVSGDTDNDYIGFAIGYEDSSNYYYFSWTKSESSGGTGPTDGWNLYKKEGGVVSTLATDQSDYTKGWEIDVNYDVTVSYSSGKMSIHVQGGSQAFSSGATIATIEDDFPSGKFGFFGSSQAGMNFSSLKFEHLYTPEISLSGEASVSVEGATSFSDPGATATDFEDGNLTSAITTTGTVNLDVVGAYQLVYSVSDSSGLSVQVNRTVNVVDTTAPVITLTGDATITHEAATAYTDGGATWTDTLDGTGSVTASGTVNVNIVGSYTLTYDYTDAAGNVAVQVSRTVNVVDTTIPTITLIGDAAITHEAATAYNDGGATWTDTLEGTGTVTADGTVDVNTLGSYILTYDYTDAAGNAAVQVSRTMNVVDTTIPVITLIGDATITHEAATAYTDGGASWTDTVDGSGSLSASGTADVNTVGSYTLTYDYTDAADNAAVQVSRTVNVVDTTAPAITLTGDATITHEAATVYTDEGATWTDTLEGTGTVTASGTVDVNTVGIYTLTYDFTDAAGNGALQVSRTVHVVDTTIPVISLHGDHNVSHPVWTPYVDAGAAAFDSLDGNLSSSLVSTSNVDEGIPGRYLITYNVQDREGNQAIELTREIHVYNQNPTAISLSNFTIDENLPVGTEVGEFSTSDPDDLDNSKSYQYLIVGGTGHERFSLSSDGILTSAFVFDYEAENSFEISVRTQDVFGGIFDQNFTINVVDTFHPIVETNGVFDIGINTAFFRGDVLDEGALSGVFERGFLVSTAPEPFYGDWSAIQINVGNGSGAFEASTDSLKAGTIYYVAAYAMNSEGINYGSSKKFKTDLLEEPLFIANAKKVEGAAGWWESSWLGAFYEIEQNGWVLHADMGWLFLVPDTLKEGMWFWKEGLAWIWTDSATYPYFFSQNFNGWVFFFGSDENHTLFYDYQHQNWLQIKK